MIRGQRIQLGTLRVLGFQKRTLCIYYINYFVFIVLLGSITGCIAGPLLVPEAFYVDLRKMFSLPKWQAAYSPLFFVGSMSFVERSREFAILRAQGFKSTFICAIFTIKNVIFALVGIVGGIIPGLLVTKIMCSFCGNDFDIQVTLQPLSAVIAAAITLIVSAGVTVLFLKKIICMDMVNSLKSTE